MGKVIPFRRITRYQGENETGHFGRGDTAKIVEKYKFLHLSAKT